MPGARPFLLKTTPRDASRRFLGGRHIVREPLSWRVQWWATLLPTSFYSFSKMFLQTFEGLSVSIRQRSDGQTLWISHTTPICHELVQLSQTGGGRINREPDLLRWSYVVLALDHTKYEDAFLKGVRLKTPGRNVPTRRAVEAQAAFPWLAPAAETRCIPNLPLRKVLPSGVQVGVNHVTRPRASPQPLSSLPPVRALTWRSHRICGAPTPPGQRRAPILPPWPP